MNNQSGKFGANSNSGTGNGQQNKEAAPTEYEKSPMVRMPFGLFILGSDQKSGDRSFDGQVSFKYGPEKGDWLKMSYMDMKKLIDFCIENKTHFNEYLSKERSKMAMGDL